MISFKRMFEEVYHITTHEPTYPPLNRAAFLIERACVPGFYPSYCAEAAQILAAMDACLQKGGQAESGRRSNCRTTLQE